MATFVNVETSAATMTLPAGMNVINQNFDWIASVASTEGASMIGVNNSGANNLTSINVEAALVELQLDIDTRALTSTLASYVLTSTLAAPGGAALIGASSGNTVQQDLTTALSGGAPDNVVTVGTQGMYSTIQAAIDSITDSSLTNRYVVQLGGASHQVFSFGGKTGIIVNGIGPASIIQCDTASSQYINCWSTSCGLSNLHVDLADNAAVASNQSYALWMSGGGATDFYLDNVSIYVNAQSGTTAPRYAIGVNNAAGNWRSYNLKIVTESHGILIPNGNDNYWYNTNINLTGNETGIDRIALHITASGHSGRNKFIGGYIGSGYGVAHPNATGVSVYGLLVEATAVNTSFRVAWYNISSFVRNEAVSIGELYNVKMENGWFRAGGGMWQAENPNTAPSYDAKAVYGALDTASEPATGNKGKIELYGVRHSGSTGSVIGDSSIGVRRITSSVTLGKLESGVIEADPTAGNIEITLDNAGNSNNESLTVINTHATNLVTVVRYGSILINGVSNNLVVPNLGSVTLRRTGQFTWWSESAGTSSGTSSSGAMSASIALPFGFAGTSSTLPTNSGSVRLHSKADCFIEFGTSSVTTTTASMYFAAGTEVFGVPTAATHIAVKTAGEAGVLNVVGLDADTLQELTTNVMVQVQGASDSMELPVGTTARLFSMTDCYINFGTYGVVADETSMFFEAGTEILAVPAAATHIAAKRYTLDGGLYITGVN